MSIFAYQSRDLVYILEPPGSPDFAIGRILKVGGLINHWRNGPHYFYDVQIVTSTRDCDKPGEVYRNLADIRLRPYILTGEIVG